MNKVNRRSFIKGAGSAAAASFVLPRFSIAQSKQSANSKLNIAFVGVGGIGGMALRGCSGENVVALCDIEAKALGNSKKNKGHENAKTFSDYREMLDKMGKDIDAVCVSTPDHTHFKIAMDSMSAGKHICVQKPLTRNVWQARELKKAKEYYKNLKSQMMNQGHATEHMRFIKEWYDAGVLGTVKEAHVWVPGPNFKGAAFGLPESLPIPQDEIPEGVNWDCWMGDAKETYFSKCLHPKKWRSFWDYGTGMLGDWFCHTGDAPVYALDLKDAVSVELVKIDKNFDGTVVIPNSSAVKWVFAKNDKRPEVTLYWYDGGNRPEKAPFDWEKGKKIPGAGMWMLGDKHTLETGSRPNNDLKLTNKEAWLEFRKKIEGLKTIPRAPKGDLFLEWIADIKGEGPECGSNFGYAAQLTEVALLGVIVQRFGGKIEWDSKKGLITNRPELNAYIKEKQRKGWETKPLA